MVLVLDTDVLRKYPRALLLSYAGYDIKVCSSSMVEIKGSKSGAYFIMLKALFESGCFTLLPAALAKMNLSLFHPSALSISQLERLLCVMDEKQKSGKLSFVTLDKAVAEYAEELQISTLSEKELKFLCSFSDVHSSQSIKADAIIQKYLNKKRTGRLIIGLSLLCLVLISLAVYLSWFLLTDRLWH